MSPPTHNLPACAVPDEARLGPAMRALNERQRAFVIAMLDLGCASNHTRAAEIAGYSTASRDALTVTAHRLAHDSRVQEALLEEARKRLTAGTLQATALLVETIGDVTAERKDRLKAAQMLLDRGGLHALTEHKVQVEHTDNREEKIRRLVDLARAQGKDPKEFIGNLADAIEADFEVIDDKDTGTDGLEDLLG